MPNDYDTNRLRYSAPRWVKNKMMDLIRKIAIWCGRFSEEEKLEYSILLKSSAPALSQFATKSSNIIPKLIQGKCKLVGDIVSFKKDGVIVEGGEEYKCDSVIFCTGYKVRHPFLSFPQPCVSHLYKKVFLPTLGTRVAFIGFARPFIGSQAVISEMQARWFSRLVSEEIKLPQLQTMIDIIRLESFRDSRLYPQHKNKPILVNFIPYVDDLAEFVGCRPNFYQLLKQPYLLW
eukprot:CAMPEP_0174267304 /NCGR_PEP_ID=MMETSP0439-20130205/33201_1 /TAXON_ID=0 /ORGANISM="Stereomyxa ramosa, Strain Chinc5" /LENGTH=232 /DNA_ID=CAMNT_0015354729 /DNA_START=165 /DNA_END=860 /DNA_ORIENTATION=+